MENRIGYQIELLRSKMTDDPDKKVPTYVT